MCYNKETSIYAFLIGFVSGIILLNNNNKEDKYAGIVCIMISLIQLTEFFLRNNQECNYTNHILSIIILVILYLQAVIFGYINLDTSNKNDTLIYNILFTIYTLSFIYILYNIYNKKQKLCSLKDSTFYEKSRLSWDVFKKNDTTIFSILYVLLLLLYASKLKSYPIRKITPFITFILAYIYSSYNNHKTNIFGTMWCFLSIILGPISLMYI